MDVPASALLLDQHKYKSNRNGTSPSARLCTQIRLFLREFKSYQKSLSMNALYICSGATNSAVNNIISDCNNSTTASTIRNLCNRFGITIMGFFQPDLFLDPEREIK